MAVGDEEQGVARVAGVEDDLAAAESARAKGRRDELERGVVEAGEQAAVPQRLPRGIWRGGGPDHGLHRTRREPLAAGLNPVRPRTG